HFNESRTALQFNHRSHGCLSRPEAAPAGMIRQLHIPNHSPPLQTDVVWTLQFGISLEFEAWDLKFPSSPAPRRSIKISTPHARAPNPAAAALRRSRLAFLKQRGVFVIEILQFHAGNFLAYEPLDGVHVPAVLGYHQGERVARSLGAAGASNAVNVIL